MTLLYSVVIPVKDEEENLIPLFHELCAIMEQNCPGSWEAIFVEDGSKDRSLAVLQELAAKDTRLKLITFDRNYGQSAAFYAGFKKAIGRYIITMDADLQNDPHDIPKLLVEKNADLIVGWRKERKDPLQKRLISRVSNKIRSRFLEDHVHDSGCSLKLFKKECMMQVVPFVGMHRFLPALFQLNGFKVMEVEVNHRPRLKGKTKYTFFNRSLRPIIDLFALIWMRKRKLSYREK